MKKDSQGNPIPTDEPHWIDHIPVGFYVLEETLCPYDQGYVQSESVNVEIQETGHVQSFEMEDDFTALRFGNWMESGTRCSAVIQKQDLPFTEPSGCRGKAG